MTNGVPGSIEVAGTGKDLNTVVVETSEGSVHNEVIDQGNVTSTNNSRDAANLAAAATWTGTGEDVSRYGRVGVSFKCDNVAPLTVWMEVSHDGVSYGGPPRTVVDPSTAQPIMWNIVEKYFRIRVVCGATEAQNLSVQTQYSNNADIILAHPLDETLIDEMGASLTRSVLVGQTPGGAYVNVPVDNTGQLRTNQPLTAFGETMVAENVPTFQADFIYGGPHEQLITETEQTGGAVSYADGMAVCTSGATDLGLAAVSSKRFVKYRAGQGILTRFTAIFDAPTVSSIQGAGLSNGENGVLVGYRFGTEFGIWRQTGGLREVQTLTVTTGSNHNEDITITLDGNAVTDVTVTNGGSTSETAWEIAQHDYSTVGDVGWKAYAEGSTVVFVCEQTSPRAGTFSLSGASSAVGTFAETVGGAAPTVSAVLQSAFNVDTLDGDGDAANPSGLNLDPTKGNVYQIDVQYLGFGAIRYYIEDSTTGRFRLFHIENNTNSRTTPSMANPSLVWSLSAYNFTGASVACKSASAALYTQGPRIDPIVRYSADVEALNVSSGSLRPILSLKPKQIHNGVLNLGEALVEEMSVSFEGTKPNRVEVFIGATLSNDADFVDEGGDSMMMYDTSATSMSGGAKLFARAAARTGEVVFTKDTLGEFFLNRNMVVTIAVRTGANNTDVDAAAVWAEDV